MSISLDIRQYLATQPIDLPVFNPVALNILQLTADPDTDIEDVVRAINEDQSLAAQILKVANSPVFMGLSKMETIKASVVRLGSRQVANLAMAASQASIHTSENSAINAIMQELFTHSNACAIGCWWVAQNSGYKALAEQAYMAGLLHDIGKLYLLKALDQIVNSTELTDTLDRQLILGVFSELHIEQGCRIMDHWNLPPIYRAVVANHHLEEPNPDDALLAVVRLVNKVSRKFGLSLDLDKNPDTQPEIMILNLSKTRCSELDIVMKGYFDITQ